MGGGSMDEAVNKTGPFTDIGPIALMSKKAKATKP
jgi:hypothetical protein